MPAPRSDRLRASLGAVVPWWAAVITLSCGGGVAETEARAPVSELSAFADAQPQAAATTDEGRGSAGRDSAEPTAENGRAGGWPVHTRSPRLARAVPAHDGALYERCGQPDLGLIRVAGAIIERRLDRQPPPTPSELSEMLRGHGVPHVWPRAWASTGVADEQELQERLGRWARRQAPRGSPRCGIARGADPQGQPVVAAVHVDALADLQPLPVRARLSGWLALEALLNVPADGAHVLLLGPRGRPRRVLASLSEGRILSRFSVDQPGRWVVQVLAHVATGPEPVLEASVFAGVEPKPLLADGLALAELSPDQDAGAALLRLLNAARRSERLAALRRDGQLDRLAQQHVADMVASDRVAHDLGRGTVEQRLQAVGLHTAEVGENVAAARTIARTHRALWASPSHRENMLHHAFRRVGIGVLTDEQGTLWVTQIFTE